MLQKKGGEGVTEARWRWDQQISATVVIKEPVEGLGEKSLASDAHLGGSDSARVCTSEVHVCVLGGGCVQKTEKGKEGWSIDHREQYTKGI